MINLNHFSKNSNVYVNAIFIASIIIYLALGQLLIWNIPYSFPFGGPDEIMHLSMADYISRHLSWPDWDSLEVVRNAYGVSYNAGGSIVYWLHGLSFKIFGYHRIGAFLLLVAYLLLAIFAYRKNRLAGFMLLAGLFPQTLFIFSYVNSDAGTIVSAVLLGVGVGMFITGEDKVKNLFILFFFAGLAVTARQHLWAIAFITLIWALVYKRKVLYGYDKKILIFAVLIALVPASWWFVTSYLANDGDILGVFTNAKSIAKFSTDNLPILSREWADISLVDFLYETGVSFYANWGWMSLGLDSYEYISVLIVSISIVFLVYKNIDRKVFFFFVMLVATNLGFMLLYSTFYDYQAQGRYLFPSIYIIVGVISAIIVKTKVLSKTLLVLLVVLSMQNIYFSSKLALFSYVDVFQQKPALYSNKSEQYFKDAQYHIDQWQIIDGKLLLRGWIFNAKNGKSFKSVHLVLKNGEKFYRVELKQDTRIDVSTAFKSSNLDSSGFSAKMIDLRELEKGTYKYIFEVPIDKKPMFIDINQSLTI
jgi:hypothetical protein